METCSKERVFKYLAYIQLKMIAMTPAMAPSGFSFNLIVNDNDDARREELRYIATELGLGGDETYALVSG